MRKNYISLLSAFILGFIFFINVSGQSFEINERLDWKSPSEPQPGHFLLNFEGAVNHEAFGFLPVFQQIVPGNKKIDHTQTQITEAIYEPLIINDINNFPDLELITEQPGIIISTITSRKVTSQVVTLLPLRKSPSGNGFEKLVFFRLDVIFSEESLTETNRAGIRNYAAHSVLNSGDWYRISVKQTGVHKISYQDLEAMGINPATVNPKNIRLYGNGSGMLEESNAIDRPDDLLENAIFISGESDGIFDTQDYILFYGEEPAVVKYNPFYLQFEHELNFYTEETYYFLTIGSSEGKRLQAAAAISDEPTHEVNSFQDLAYHDLELVNLAKTGKIWYGETFNTQLEYIFPFDLQGLDNTRPITAKVNLAGRSTVKTVFKFFADGVEIEEFEVPSLLFGTQVYARSIVSNYEPFYTDDEQVNIGLTFVKPSATDIGWLNFIELNYFRHLAYEGGQYSFRDVESTGVGYIARYHIKTDKQGLQLWEVTGQGTLLSHSLSSETGGYYFKAKADILREFILFDGKEFFTPEFVEKVENQDLHSLSPADYIIVSHPLFLEQASRIADHHRHYDGMSSLIVTPQQIYNEFSSGAQDVSAIRDFVKMLYDRALPGEEPKHLLLFGDASYDYKGILEKDENLVPAYQSRESLRLGSSFVSDDYFGCLDDDEGSTGAGSMDLGIGRFPVTTIEQAEIVVTKTINYTLPTRENFGPWRNSISFVGDDKDLNTHFKQAEGLADITDSLGGAYNVNKIYLDAYQQFKTSNGIRYPDVNVAINNDIEAGCLIMNYTGHGGEIAWADERVLDIPAIQSYKNSHQLPAFVTATCEFSRYDDPGLISAGELVLLNPNGAGIGLFTTTRLAYSQSNYAYNKRFYYEAFKVDSVTGKVPSMGDLIMAAKTPSNPNIKNLVLLGDPALTLAYPKMRVRTLNVKKEDTGRPADTLQALSLITVEGQVEDLYGNRLEGFNGILYHSVYDKPVLYQTRGNDPASRVADFYIQDKKLSKGETTVSGGLFSFTFMVPVDISYQYGKGKISYYALDTITLLDAQGFDEVLIGGSESNAPSDNQGPDIELYLNSLSFVSGDITSPDPLLIAKLYDENGINTVGNGIGHDIVAVIDGNYQQQVILNDYYIPAPDSYQEGTIQYRLGPFENGWHSLTLRAWDVLNNSSEKTIEFQVNAGAKLSISQLEARPNPYTDKTSFYFKHNTPGNEYDILIHVFDLMGRRMTTLEYTVQSETDEIGPLDWNGRDESGNELSEGLYVYSVVVKSEDGFTAVLSQKLLHIR